jgi:hypothetical protein
MNAVPLFEIKSYLTGEVLHTVHSTNLRGADMSGLDLQNADFRFANLRDVDFRDANLQGANLRGANLQGADLRGANIEGADLQDADLTRTSVYANQLCDGMNNWITNRLPTKKDSFANQVITWYYNGVNNGVMCLSGYKDVDNGEPWQPIPKPAPYVNNRTTEINYE